MIDYSDFISREWFLIAWRADTHIHTNKHAYQLLQKQFQEIRCTPAEGQCVPGLKVNAKEFVLNGIIKYHGDRLLAINIFYLYKLIL